jgi:hypothetical protein
MWPGSAILSGLSFVFGDSSAVSLRLEACRDRSRMGLAGTGTDEAEQLVDWLAGVG